MDDDRIEKALEPGEKVVWSDRPHGVLRAALRTLRDEWWLLFLAAPSVLYLALAAPILVTATAAIACAIVLARRVVVRLDARYLATSKGRLFVLEGRELRWTELPRAELVTTPARAGEEFGPIHLGKAIVLHDVSYPLIAVETLRSACPKGP